MQFQACHKTNLNIDKQHHGITTLFQDRYPLKHQQICQKLTKSQHL